MKGNWLLSLRRVFSASPHGGRGMASAAPAPVAAPLPKKSPPGVGAYQRLHAYLRDRYANRVVLTFAEIEDVLGFALPDPARHQAEWWAADDDPIAPHSAQAGSWLLASRTATVNLTAQRVVFDRAAS